MPNTLTAQGVIRVSPTGAPFDGDANRLITIVAPTVRLTSPNTNVSWPVGSTRSINWSHNLGAQESVTIEVSRDGGASWEIVASSAQDTSNTAGSFSWLVARPATAAARIRLSWQRDGSVQTVNDVNFRIQ